MKAGIDLREKGDNPDTHVQVKVAMATCGIASGAKTIMDFFIEHLKEEI
jgi:NADP-reducing hydrogenase subunit HndB